MDSRLSKVIEFHRAFEQLVSESPTIDVPDDVKALRVRLIEEEVGELKKALQENDIVGVLDALEDIEYVLMGTVASFGMQDVFDQGFDEVHSSNMSKLGPDGKPVKREDGKVTKSSLYRPPNLSKFVYLSPDL